MKTQSSLNFESAPKIKQLLHAAEIQLEKVFKEKLKKIILFGSYSRGDYDKESDVDVMVLVDNCDPRAYDDIILDMEVDLSITFDIVLTMFVESEAEYEKARRYKPYINEIDREGIEIYAT